MRRMRGKGAAMDTRARPTGEELRRYITENIDRAIAEDWIKVYYQPVARTITGEICGMEALARWMDPEYGMFPPAAFIGVLEEACLIHKLDSCIIHKTCADYARSMAEDERTVTVSFNLSRLDFKLMDVHSVIEKEIRANKVPRDAFRVEITESMMDSDDEHLHEAIDRFWERGFRVWMDDFGSGYSSLNVLKDYHFDTLKIDMVFLRNYDARSREIVKSVVDMSKRLGVHTLAEGVESKEQFEFLKSIGCEKAQGYYIGKPMPYDECRAYLKEKGFVMEPASKRKYYHDIGKVNVLSATPLRTVDNTSSDPGESDSQMPIAFVEYAGERLHYLFANKSYMSTLKKLGVESLEEIEESFEDKESALHIKFLAMIEQARETNEVVTTDFVRGSNYCYAQVRAIAGYPGGNAYLCILQNLSDDTIVAKSSLLSKHMQSLCSVYEMITLVDLNTLQSETIYASTQSRHVYNRRPAPEELRDYARHEIYPEDSEKFVAFTDLTTVEKRIADSPTRHISAPFRTRTTGGTYVWSLYSFLFDGDPAERRVLSCFRRLAPETVARLHGERDIAGAIGKDVQGGAADRGDDIPAEVLWKNFNHNSDTAFFWKDKQRRFLGANKKFLDYFDMPSDEVLLGKTDEDMGWHIDPEPYRTDEERVIREGEQTYLVPGSCICKGEIKDILASKYPLYMNGEIVGLMGYFLDVTDWKTRAIGVEQITASDPVTGTLNFLGLVEALLRYQDGFVMENRDFAMILFDVIGFHRFRADYGHEWSEKLLKEIAFRMQKVMDTEGVAGRLSGDNFMVIGQFDNEEAVEDTIRRISSAVEEIKAIDNMPVTIYLSTGYEMYSVTKDVQELYINAKRRLNERSDS